MRFAWIHVEKATHAVRRLCRVLAVTPSGYYAWMHRRPTQRARDNDRLQVRIRAIHAASRGTYGCLRRWLLIGHRHLRDRGRHHGFAARYT